MSIGTVDNPHPSVLELFITPSEPLYPLNNSFLSSLPQPGKALFSFLSVSLRLYESPPAS